MWIRAAFKSLGAFAFVCVVGFGPLAFRVHAQELRRGAASRAVLDLSIPTSDDPAWDLSFIRDMTVDSAGRIYVLEKTDQTVRIYDANGRAIKKLGRKGEGPGEFTYALKLLIRGDTVVVLEPPLNRVTWFPPDIRGVRTVRVLPKTSSPSSIMSLWPSGYLVSTGSAVGQSAGGSAAYVAVDTAGKVGATIVNTRPMPRPFIIISRRQGERSTKNGSRGYMAQPLGRHMFGGVAPDEATLVTGEEKNSDALFGKCMIVLTARDARGQTRWTRDLTCERVPFTSAHLTALLDSFAKPKRIGGAIYVADRKMLEDSLFKTATWPVVTDSKIGVDGTIWLQQGGPATGGDRYWRLSPTGVPETSVELPPGFVLKAASRSKLWGWRLDADGLPVVERYRY
jgi:hypothetical protein